MGRPTRVQAADAIYHVTARGTGPSVIFREGDDRRAFLALLATVVSRYSWECYAYCLMNTHYHLLLRTPEANIAAGMHQLNSCYARSFNRRHGRVGALFQSRYHAVLVETEEHAWSIVRYLALNPVRAGLCARPEEWPWSSYSELVGAAPRGNVPITPLEGASIGRDWIGALRELVESAVALS